jgi:hypothetical protein
MGQRGRISFPPDGKLVERLDERRARIIAETGESLSRSALIRVMLRTSLGDSAFEALTAEAHFRLGPALRRALGRLARETQERLGELVEEELRGAGEE